MSSILQIWSAEINFLRFFLTLKSSREKGTFGSSWVLWFLYLKDYLPFNGEAQHPCNLGWIRSMSYVWFETSVILMSKLYNT